MSISFRQSMQQPCHTFCIGYSLHRRPSREKSALGRGISDRECTSRWGTN
ncbi:hypothetical protein QWZ16_11980 [Vibrio ostreicida]|uniref:DUF3265 domain-containing protein n=1 Tax=Vibrio ostreicida TaxID=526588 RepID=A0ABT8BVK7_9VIBR|nr:hypothetical protein [Vibrio ostreicida]MDN3610424.1 hypothetical protein [Vibrio ostreicida]